MSSSNIGKYLYIQTVRDFLSDKKVYGQMKQEAEKWKSSFSDDIIKKNDIDMDIASESAAIIASAYKCSVHVDGIIEPNSIRFVIYK